MACECNKLEFKLLDQKEVSDILKVSTKTMEYYRWKKKGPRFIKVGGLVRYIESDIHEYIGKLVKSSACNIEAC